MSCLCCSAFRPRYKKLVDNIYPDTTDGSLVTSEMTKLTYYAVSAPEKLDRIGDYLAHRLSRDIHRHRVAQVFVAMEALDTLLLSCHAQQINLFVESFIKMVGELLESQNIEFQALGTNSFVKFCQIEEDTNSYHRGYDFFISKFSEMCYHFNQSPKSKGKSQWHGVKGIQGVIRKNVSDEMQMSIWHKHHMDKIIPALLYVMMINDKGSIKTDSGSDHGSESSQNPSKLAEECLRELLSRATFSNCGAALKPALSFMDSQNLWIPDNSFAIKIFKIFMYSVQGQYSHVVVKSILDHLDQTPPNETENKSSLLNLLQVVVKIPSSSPIGPAVIEVFNQLFQNLETSSKQSTNQEAFHETFLDCINTLAEVLPEYQKLEAMVFFISKCKDIFHYQRQDMPNKLQEPEEVIINVIFKSLLKIAENYNEPSISSISTSLLDPLLKVSLYANVECRLLSQKILLQILDRRKNLSKFQVVCSPGDVGKMKIPYVEPTKHETSFIERKLPLILHWQYDILCSIETDIEIFILAYKLICVICYSTYTPEIVIALCRLMLTLQETAMTSQNLTLSSDLDMHRCALMSLVYAGMAVISKTSKLTYFVEYVTNVLMNLQQDNVLFETLDPTNNLSSKKPNKSHNFPNKIPERILFSKTAIQDALPSDFDTVRLQQPLVSNLSLDGNSMDISRSVMLDAESVKIEFASTPEQKRSDKHINAQNVTYEYIKNLMLEPFPTSEEIKLQKENQANHVKNATFEQLLTEMQENEHVGALENILNKVAEDQNIECYSKSFSDITFPSICVI